MYVTNKIRFDYKCWFGPGFPGQIVFWPLTRSNVTITLKWDWCLATASVFCNRSDMVGGIGSERGMASLESARMRFMCGWKCYVCISDQCCFSNNQLDGFMQVTDWSYLEKSSLSEKSIWQYAQNIALRTERGISVSWSQLGEMKPREVFVGSHAGNKHYNE